MFKMTTIAVLALLNGCSLDQAPPPPQAPAAARAKAPTCAMIMTAPRAVEGANLFGTGTLADCAETDWNGVLQVRVNAGDGLLVGVDIDRTQAVAGNTLDIGVQASVLSSAGDYASCEGSVTWTSDEPDWVVSVDAVCHDAAGDYNLVASFRGHVY